MKSFKLIFILSLFILACENTEEGTPEPEFTTENEKELNDLILEEIFNNPSVYGEILPAERQFPYAYLNRVQDSILTTNNLTNENAFNWDVFLISDTFDSKVFAIPGGSIFMSTGLILDMNGEDELATVLAREMSYIENRLALNKILEVYGIPLTIESFSDTNRTNIPAMADLLINSPYNVANEQLGDLNSVRLTCGLSYASFALAKLYLRIEEDSLSALSKNFTFYPNSESRRNRILEEYEELSCLGNENYSQNFEVLKDSLIIQ